jgi:nitric oxide reductase NorQ protein
VSIAILIESDLEVGKEQTLLVPNATSVMTFHRFSNGQRGRGQAWQVVADPTTLPTTEVRTEPIAVILSQRDTDNASVGNVTALSIKAMSFGQGNQLSAPMAHNSLVIDLITKLTNGDMELNKYVRDGRRTNPIILRPLSQPAEQYLTSPSASGVVTSSASELDKVAMIVPQNSPTNNVVVFPNKAHIEVAKVPDKKWADTYINRKIDGRTEFDIYDVAMENHENILIRGHAGSGKTMSVLAYASARGYKYYNVSANVGLEPSHLFGSWIPTENGTFTWQDGAVTSVVRHGGVLLLNEIDFIPERITTVLFGLLDDRRQIQLLENGGEIIEAHPELLIIGDHNPAYRGSRPMNQAWKDRFHHKLEFPYDKVIERKLIPNPSLLDVADKLRTMADKGEVDTPVSTRGLVAFVNNTRNISLDYAITSYVNGFSDDEREAIKLVLDTAKSNIATDFGLSVSTTTEQADETSQWKQGE